MKTACPLKMTALISAVMIFICLQIAPAGSVEGSEAISLTAENRILQASNNRMWQANRSKKTHKAEDAESYLQKLNQGTYNDWRLPTKQELYDLFSIFDLKLNGDIKIRLEGNYWLSDDKNNLKYVGGWQIGDGCGPSRSFYKGKEGYVRAVRP